ncbi:hypothetical protein KALB_6670 [Kutzneria albida DSM 43870]|uniref:TAXI family TRAP transporter solute-binding subunit n=1 Tax=Kutzneria albida DSM 43870 TaxID=1449976 RepID=W5WPB8_9PSEU|nr:hypothetical protein KALB_6670 [Kutzneria albida DSM 43870]
MPRLTAVLALLVLLAACQPDLAGQQLRIATGNSSGVYFQLGSKLADTWHSALGINASTSSTQGSVDNLNQLHEGKADVALVAADAASKDEAKQLPGTPLRALGRIYDDYIQVVARADSGIERMSDLRGKRVSVGGTDSGVTVVARNLLELAGLTPATGTTQVQLALQPSLDALAANQVDAFFWSGGLPTPAITNALAKGERLRLVNLEELVKQVRNKYSYYDAATVPKTAYANMADSVTTLVVHNLLMVRQDMPADEARALVRALFDAQPTLAEDGNQVVKLAAQLLDVRAAIETSPITLHDGALEYYRSVKQ